MREILFRVRDNGHWYYGLPLRITENNVQFSGVDENGADVYSMFNERETLGEYTGLCDKNGKKIFEGDILEYNFDDIGKQKAVVCWDSKYAAFQLKVISTNFEYTEISDGEVIGNIHDNPELLGGKSNEK